MSEENQPINEELDPELTGSEGIEESSWRMEDYRLLTRMVGF